MEKQLMKRIDDSKFKAKQIGSLSPAWLIKAKEPGFTFFGEYGAIVSTMSYKNDHGGYNVQLCEMSQINYAANNNGHLYSSSNNRGILRQFAAGFSASPSEATSMGENPNRPAFVAREAGARIMLTAKNFGEVFAYKVEKDHPVLLRPGAIFAIFPGVSIKTRQLPQKGNAILSEASGFKAMQELSGNGYILVQCRGDALDTLDNSDNESNNPDNTSANDKKDSTTFTIDLNENEEIVVNLDVLILLSNVNITEPYIYSNDALVTASLENGIGARLKAGPGGGKVVVATTCQRHKPDDDMQNELLEDIAYLKKEVETLKGKI